MPARKQQPKIQRASGVLLHPTSLPGNFGIGELGDEALAFLDFLAAAGQTRWQVLPLGPTSYGDSPYQAFSAFAGNPLLISTARLQRDGLLTAADLADCPDFPEDYVDYGAVIPYKQRLLRRAYARAKAQHKRAELSGSKQPWLADFSLFMALKAQRPEDTWAQWQPALVHREPAALAAAQAELADEIAFQQFCQQRFFADWRTLKAAAAKRKIAIIGDLPIFVAYDSADLWTHQHLFFLDKQAQPTKVAGVPPDYFSKTGQRWGNPLYRWSAMARDDYAWWLARLQAARAMFDLMRIDHFRGFVRYWAIPSQEKTAIKGRWEKGPGAAFFEAAREHLGNLPIIAEDLGVITPDVVALRKQFGLPGMVVLQFAGSGPENIYLPHHYEPHSVVYTGTHDNNTTRGWWPEITATERAFFAQYLDRRPTAATISWYLIRLALSSVANTAIIPLQDLLNLGAKARLNTPGTSMGNWAWRYRADQLTPALERRLHTLSALYSRTSE